MSNNVCLYHSHCPDGFTAAWLVFWHLNGDVDMVPMAYNRPAPDVTGKNVWVVDFSFSLDETILMAQTAATLRVLDHHESALRNLAEFPRDDFETAHIELDMGRSGAKITYDYIEEAAGSHSQGADLFVRYIQDRDLWTKALPDSEAVFAAISARPYTVDAWSELCWSFFEHGHAALAKEGAAIQMYRERMIESAVAGATEVTIDGHQVLVANCSYEIASDVAGQLALGRSFGAYYVDRGDERHWGLRSTKDAPHALNVAEIAEKFGGGGHANASGFRTARWDVPE